MSRTLSSHNSQFAIAIHPRIVIRGRQRKDLIQMIPLDPVLQFARRVSGICALFEHGHHNDLDWNRRSGRLGRSLRGRYQGYEE